MTNDRLAKLAVQLFATQVLAGALAKLFAPLIQQSKADAALNDGRDTGRDMPDG